MPKPETIRLPDGALPLYFSEPGGSDLVLHTASVCLTGDHNVVIALQQVEGRDVLPEPAQSPQLWINPSQAMDLAIQVFDMADRGLLDYAKSLGLAEQVKAVRRVRYAKLRALMKKGGT